MFAAQIAIYSSHYTIIINYGYYYGYEYDYYYGYYYGYGYFGYDFYFLIININ